MEYDFTLTGQTPLLMHADDIDAADSLKEWRSDSRNKSISVPGDDRSPPWTWQTYVYSDPETGEVAVPAANVMAALRNGGAKVPYKGQTTFKSLSQSGILISASHCKLRNDGKPVMIADVHALRDLPFNDQADGARKLGFTLYKVRAKINTSKNVRVRPRFDVWDVTGTVFVSEPAITRDKLTDIFAEAGRQAGLGDWRPGSKTPGSYGIFSATITPKAAKRNAS